MNINTQELLQELYTMFPDKVPDKVETLRELGMKIGEQRPMKFIEHYVERMEHEAKQKSKAK